MDALARNARSTLGSFIVDCRGTLLGFDHALEQLTGWPALDVVGRHKELSLAAARSRSGAPAIEPIALYDGSIPMGSTPGSLELTLRCRDGRQLDVETLVRPLNGPGDRMLVTVLRMLSRSPLRETAFGDRGRDPLTGLCDRRSFAARITADFAAASSAARPLSLILLDVDHLRSVNDREGRSAGDAVLRELSDILRAASDDEERIARLGDDDFAILLPDGGRGDARQVAATLRLEIERHCFLGDGSASRVTATLGTASFPGDADDARELLARASDALAEARTLGRNRVWCYVRRSRVPVQVPVYFDGTDSTLLGYMRDLSPSGLFLQTTAGIDVGMRCALTFPLPGHEGRVHVVGRVVRTVTPDLSDAGADARIPGVGIEFERFGGSGDRYAIDSFLHGKERLSRRPETRQSV